MQAKEGRCRRCLQCPVAPAQAQQAAKMAALLDAFPETMAVSKRYSAALLSPRVKESGWGNIRNHELCKSYTGSMDQSIFENANTAPAPKLPADKLASQPSPATYQRSHPDTGGGSQHLRSIGKTVGAKVNDFLRRKEPTGYSNGFGVTKINASAGAALPCREDTRKSGQDQAEGQTPTDAIPRLNPPPLITKKRTPRALMAPQDMLIASQPLGDGAGAPFVEESPEYASQPDRTTPAQEKAAASSPQEEMRTCCSRVFGVPDLIHKEKLETLPNTAYRTSPSSYSENLALAVNRSVDKSVTEGQLKIDSDPSKMKASTLESECQSPDLLSFE